MRRPTMARSAFIEGSGAAHASASRSETAAARPAWSRMTPTDSLIRRRILLRQAASMAAAEAAGSGTGVSGLLGGGDAPGDPARESKCFEQRIAREPIRAVQAGCRHFAAGP